VALLTDFDLQRTGSGQRLGHRDGTPFTTEENDLLGSATDDDLRAAASDLAAAPARLAELFMPSLRTVAEQLSDHRPQRRRPEPQGQPRGDGGRVPCRSPLRTIAFSAQRRKSLR
jgi:hypothetical protein